MLRARVLSALVFVPGTLALLWVGGVAFRCYVVAVALLGAHELLGMAGHARTPRALWSACCGAVAAFIAFGLPAGLRLPLSPLELAAAGLLLLFVVSVISPGEIATSVVRLGAVVLAALYCGVLPGIWALLRDLPHGFGWAGLALACPWMADTAAYFAGRALGRHKLHPVLSPAKTIEGAIGGLLGAVAGAFLARALDLPDLTALHCVVLGLVAGAMGQFGDLAESMLKRAYEVKDSGRLLPGHGGILDRFDALLFVVPTVYLYALHVVQVGR